MDQSSVMIEQVNGGQNHVNCAPASLAEAADLVYVSDSDPSFQRRRAGRGFT